MHVACFCRNLVARRVLAAPGGPQGSCNLMCLKMCTDVLRIVLMCSTVLHISTIRSTSVHIFKHMHDAGLHLTRLQHWQR
jgi:hypothetical protein